MPTPSLTVVKRDDEGNITKVRIEPFWYNPENPWETSPVSKPGWELHPAFRQIRLRQVDTEDLRQLQPKMLG